MARVLKFITAAAATFAGFVVLVITILLLIPNETYRVWLTQAVSSATGRELGVDGIFEIEFGSRVKVHATDVRFANAEWGSEPSMLTIGRIDAALSLVALFEGVVDVTLDLDTPNVLLETDAAGRGNWQMSDGAELDNAEPPELRWRALVPYLRIARARFRFHHGDSGRMDRFYLDRFQFGAPDARLTAVLDGRYQHQRVTLSADLGAVEDIVGGNAADARLDASLGDIALAITGSWMWPVDSAGPTVDLLLALDVPSTSSFEPFAGGSLPQLGSLELSSRIGGGGDQFVAEEMELLIAGSNIRAEVGGRIGDLTSLTDMAFNAELESDAVPAIAEALGLDLPGTLPRSFVARGKIAGGLERLSLEDFSARLSEGGVAVELSGAAEDLLTQQGAVASLMFTAPSLASLSDYAGRQLPESGEIRIESQLASKGQTYEISQLELKIEGEDLNGELTGSVADLLTLSGVKLDLDAQVGSLANFSEFAGVPMPDTTPLRVETRVEGGDGGNGPTDLSAIFDGDWLRGKIEATVDDVLTAQGIDAVLDLELRSLAVLSGFVGRELPPMGPIRARGRLASVGETYRLTDLDIGAEDEALTARISGSVDDLLTASGVDLGLEARVGSLSNFSGIAGTNLPVTKPLALNATTIASEGTEGTVKFSADLESDWLNGKVATTVADIRAARGVSGDVNLTLQSLEDLSGIVGRELPPMGPFKASATFATEGDAVAVSKLGIIIEDPALRAKLAGTVANALALTGVKLELEAAADSASNLSSLVGRQLPETPPMKLITRVTAHGSIQGPVEVVSEVTSDQVRLDARGTIAALTEAARTRVDVSLDANSLATLGKLVGTPLADIGPVVVTTNLGGSSEEIDLLAMDVLIGRSDLSGELKLVLPSEGGKGRISGALKSRLLDLNELRGAATTPRTPVSAASDDPTVSGDGRVFSNDPLPLEFLTHYDALVELMAEQVRFPDLTAEDGQLKLLLENGNLQVEPVRAQVDGRPLSASLRFDAGKRPSPFALELKADQVALTQLLEEGAYLQGGELYVDMNVHSAGNSVREIMAGMDGYLSIAMRNTRLAGSALEFIGKDFLSQINPMSAPKGYSELECSALVFDFESGLAKTPRGLVSRNTSATWLGSGRIDLREETLNVTFRSKPRSGVGISLGKLASLLQLTGTLANPTVRPDPVGVAKTGVETALAVTTFGASLLAMGIFDRATSGGAVCEEILELVILGKDPRASTDESASKGDSGVSTEPFTDLGGGDR